MKKDLVIFVMKMEEMTIALQPYCFRYGGRVVEDGGNQGYREKKALPLPCGRNITSSEACEMKMTARRRLRYPTAKTLECASMAFHRMTVNNCL